MDFMKKEFGVTNINREMFKDCFDNPINMANISDDDMQKLADDVESNIRNRYPEVADEMFRLWTKSVKSVPELSEEEMDFLSITCRDAWNAYWETLEKFALDAGGEIYQYIPIE